MEMSNKRKQEVRSDVAKIYAIWLIANHIAYDGYDAKKHALEYFKDKGMARSVLIHYNKYMRKMTIRDHNLIMDVLYNGKKR